MKIDTLTTDDTLMKAPTDAPVLSFEQAMTQTRMAVCLTDPHKSDNPIVFANDAFLSLSGYSREEVLGKNCRFMQGPATDEAALQHMRDGIAAETVCVVELLNYRKNGEAFWNALHLGPIYGTDGTLKYYFGSQWDVSNVSAARAEEEQATILARELSHRMKNMFSVIGSLVRITGHYEGATHITDRIHDRITALSRAYETTLDDASSGSVSLPTMIESVLRPYDPGDGSRVSMSGDVIRIDSNVITTLGLVLHELATNATKYGALSEIGGRVSVQWRVAQDEGDKTLVLQWSEFGGPKIEVTPETSGMGSRILHSLLRTVRGNIHTDWKRDGAEITLRIKIL